MDMGRRAQRQEGVCERGREGWVDKAEMLSIGHHRQGCAVGAFENTIDFRLGLHTATTP